MLAIIYPDDGTWMRPKLRPANSTTSSISSVTRGRRTTIKIPSLYLSAMIEEANKDWDKALHRLKKAYDLNPNLEYLHEDLIAPELRAPWGRRRRVEEKWPDVKPANFKEVGEVVLVYQQGWGPQKRPHPGFPRIPKLYPVYSPQRARLDVEGEAPAIRDRGQRDRCRNQDPGRRHAGLIAMRAAGIGAKAVVADQIRQKNDCSGNRLDWHERRGPSGSAPVGEPASSFQIAKLRLKPGTYKVHAVGLDSAGNPTGEVSESWEVKVVRIKKFF